MDHRRAPIFESLSAYVKEGVAPFHVPAHKQGRFGDPEFLNFVGSNVMGIDLTSTEDLDHFHNPSGVVMKAEAYAADAYGADDAFFLVNGTSCGMQAMILAACRPGDKILVPRNAHTSVTSGIIHSGAIPVYIQPVLSDDIDFTLDLTAETVELALGEHPDVRALVVINPTYFGVVSDLKRIVELCREKDVLVLVDEAHGGHFYFHDGLPPTAMEAGADMSAVSTHKTTGSMTQSSLLLIRDKTKFTRHYIHSILNLLHTTSPSYVLLSSLDTSRREMMLRGRQHVQTTIDLAQWARNKLRTVSGCESFGPEQASAKRCFAYDQTKIVFSAKPLGILGNRLKQDLRRRHHIELELAYFFSVLALFTIGDDAENVGRFVDAVCRVFESYGHEPVPQFPPFPEKIPECFFSPREAFFRGAETRLIPLEESVDKISAETVMAYPPGIPVIIPGERISQEIIDYIKGMRGTIMYLQGPEDRTLETIKVF